MLRFWLNAAKTATSTAQKRFVEAFDRYTSSVVQQSLDRTLGQIRDIESYFAVRRRTIGAEPSFVINTIHQNLPDHVLGHRVIERLVGLCTDMLLIGNDLVSFNVE